MPEKTQIGFFPPASPEHAQVGVIEFMGQKTEDLFRMKIGKIDTIWGGGVGGDEKRQEMLDDLDRQIAHILFHSRGETRLVICSERSKELAAQ